MKKRSYIKAIGLALVMLFAFSSMAFAGTTPSSKEKIGESEVNQLMSDLTYVKVVDEYEGLVQSANRLSNEFQSEIEELKGLTPAEFETAKEALTKETLELTLNDPNVVY